MYPISPTARPPSSPLVVQVENNNSDSGIAIEDSEETIADNYDTVDQSSDGKLTLAAACKDLINHSAKFTLCRLIYIGGNVASLAILGSEDESHLAASSLINSTQTAITYTTTGVIFIIGIYAKGAIAEQRPKEIGVLFRKGIGMSAELGIPALLLTHSIGSLLKLAHQPAAVTDIIDRYNSLYCFAVPANIFFMHNIQILLATNNYMMMAMQSGLYSALLVPLSYAFMKGGSEYLPKLGEQGVGLANLIASWSSILATTIYLLNSDSYRPYGLAAPQQEDSGLSTLQLIKEGSSIGLQAGIETFYVIMLTEWIGLISQSDLSASAPAWHTTNIIAPVIFGLAHVSGVLTRYAVGEKRFQDAKQYGYASLAVGTLIPSAVLMLFMAMPEQVISLFIDKDTINNPQIIEQAKLFLFVSTASLIPDSIRNIFSGTLRAYNDTAFAMFAAIFSVVAVGTLSSALLGFRSPLSSLGIMLGRAVAFSVGAWIMTSYWRHKSRVIIDGASLNTEQSRSLYNNISTWLTDCCSLFPPAEQRNSFENIQVLGAEEEQSLISRAPSDHSDSSSTAFSHPQNYLTA